MTPNNFPATTAPPPPPPKSNTGLIIIAVLLIEGFLVTALSVGGYFLWKNISKNDVIENSVTSTESSPNSSTNTSTVNTTPEIKAELLGYQTPEAALDAEIGDWVYDILTNEADYKEYVIGPPNSEWTDVVVVKRESDGL